MANVVAGCLLTGSDLECQGVDLLSDRDEPRVVVIKALPNPHVSIVATGDNVPEEQPIKSPPNGNPVEQPHKMKDVTTSCYDSVSSSVEGLARV